MMHTGAGKKVDDWPEISLVQRLANFGSSPLARRLVLVLFIVQAVVLTFVTHIGTPPDEQNHIKFIEYYANHSASPIFEKQTPTFNLGDKTREVDYLYHYTMSLLYRVLPVSAHAKYVVIRLLTVVLALLAFLVLANVFRRLGFSPAVTTVALLVITNLPMVLMMSSAVNNDVMVWLGAALGLLLMLRLWDRPNARDVLWLLVLAVAGGLFKRTLLPLGLVFGIFALVIVWRHFPVLFKQFRRFDWKLAVAALLLLISVGLFAERVGGNIVQYRTPTPSCDRVQGPDACSVFWGDIRAAGLVHKTPERPVPLYVFPFRWLWSSVANVVDIQTQAWRHEVKPVRWLTPVLGVLLVSGVAYGLYYDRKRRSGTPDKQARQRVFVMLIALYFMVVHMLVNYGDYRQVKFFGIALNGRYILPSLLPLIGFACFYWSRWLSARPRWRATLAVLVVLSTILGSGLLMMLHNPQLIHG